MSPPESADLPQVLRSEKLQNESFPNFSNFASNLLRIFPDFSRTFRASVRGRRRSKKKSPKSPPFFNAKFPGKHEKIFTKFFWRAGKETSPPDLLGNQGGERMSRNQPHGPEQLWRDPPKNGSSKSLVFKEFFWGGNTLGTHPFQSPSLSGIRLYFVK